MKPKLFEPSIDDRDLARSRASPVLAWAYGKQRLRSIAIKAMLTLERGEYRSATLRDCLSVHHGVHVGAHSYGPCMQPGLFPREVSIGRYVSVADGVKIFRRNHPMLRISLHPYFYNPALGTPGARDVETVPLEIGHDAWIGQNAIVLPGCRSIGIGAVVAAGAVVTHDVPDFGIVAGSPAKLIRYRFEPELRQAILRSQWWLRSREDLEDLVGAFVSEPATAETASLLKENLES